MASKINLDFDFPQVDLPSNVLAWHNITEDLLNLYKQACKLKAGIFALCLKGSMKVTINLIDYTVKEGDFITLLPGTIIQFKEAISPVKMSFIGFSANTISQVNLMEIAATSYHKMVEKPIIHVEGHLLKHLEDFLTLWSNVSNDEKMQIHPSIIHHSMCAILIGVVNMYDTRPYEPIARNRQEEIYRDLLHLITQNYTKQRRAQFYAKKLDLTPQHLSTTVRQVTGGTVLDLIASVVIMDAKAKLKSTNMSVQEIAYALNFPTASFFGKYFKRYVGMSPLSYKQMND
ncbi:transcriptional regulator, AraC family [Bacteroides coprosuis DSM 18011]|mgnify:FL=1|uniref:Transcriptional regulator, AraC family n=1 Tax=Bacteroides coprosuis DSM 18011 TaxID=679937 RepID=F3ZNG2_9BACE|nr:helix-turn-helix domain-containing protein [Bacteroides coprosuis]EGJ71502.1 transcriptional regulator, AraC family [Bacteroides coprosuis DSM 18011]HJD92528.1 helix-turn-helix domain-containing protein [Bacteroides coprosuis]